MGKISPLEIESHLQRLLTPFQEYIKELTLYAITDAVETEEFQKLNKAKRTSDSSWRMSGTREFDLFRAKRKG